jgi:DsbC/DsbD-like thiol-disulfide interchange protein
MRWPAPRRIAEQGLNVIGYDKDVTLPISVVPRIIGKPVTLRLKVDYAACERLCVPVEGKAELTIADRVSSHDAALRRAEAEVPKKRALGEEATFAIRALRREDGQPRPRAIVEIAAPPGTSIDLFAEGPSPEWALPLPLPAGTTSAGLQRFAFDLDGAPHGAKYEGTLITLTAVAGGEAIEVSTPLD